LEEMDKVCLLLLNTPEKYDPVITAIETMKSEDVNLEFVKGRLLDADLKFVNGQCEKSHLIECLFSTVTFQSTQTRRMELFSVTT
jgi:hypothetical protein